MLLASEVCVLGNFCRYHIDFPIFTKVEVNGPNQHPIFAFLKRELPVTAGGGGGASAGTDIDWNFKCGHALQFCLPIAEMPIASLSSRALASVPCLAVLRTHCLRFPGEASPQGLRRWDVLQQVPGQPQGLSSAALHACNG